LTEVISIKFKNRGKVYYFDPAGIDVKTGDSVVVETSKGLELGDCVHGNHNVPACRVVPPLRPVVRIATADDLRVSEINKSREKEAMEICKQKIAEHKLDMKLADVECSFEGNKILFFFTSDGRVDFRELVKDLAGIFRTRIELRQIGVRDEAKMLGGLGCCGRPFCCSQFLDDFQPVSTKMAKVQSMSLNPAKISGSCGRLMCCLRYEQEAYEDLVKKVPKNGAFVQTDDGYGTVTQVNLLRQQVKVRLDGDGEADIRSYSADDIAAVPGGRPKPGETPPDVLKDKPRPAKVEEPEEMPELVWKHAEPEVSEPTPAAEAAEAAEEVKKKPSRRRGKGRGGKGHGGEKPAADKAGEAAPKSAKPQGKTPAGEKADAPAGEKSEKRHSHRGGRNHRPKQHKEGGAPAASKPAAPEPGVAQKPAVSGEQGQKKSGSHHHRRHRPHKKSGGAPKSEAQ